jgi:hypothetical protein
MRPQSDNKHLNGTAVNSTGMQHNATADRDKEKAYASERYAERGDEGRVKPKANQHVTSAFGSWRSRLPVTTTRTTEIIYYIDVQELWDNISTFYVICKQT